MKVQFITDGKENEFVLEPGDIVGHFAVTKEGKLTKEGIPRHSILPSKIITLGMSAHPRQFEFPSSPTLASQAYLFKVNNPHWELKRFILPEYATSIDEVTAFALLDGVSGPSLIQNGGSALKAFLFEIGRYISNPFAFSQISETSVLYNLLNEFPYPSKRLDRQTRLSANEFYLYERASHLCTKFEEGAQALVRVFPNISHEIVYEDADSALLLLPASVQFGSDDLIAQQYFCNNPESLRVIVVRHVHNSNSNGVSVYNSRTRNDDLSFIPFPSVRDLNAAERKLSAKAEQWRIGRGMLRSPKTGSIVPIKELWAMCRIQSPEESSVPTNN